MRTGKTRQRPRPAGRKTTKAGARQAATRTGTKATTTRTATRTKARATAARPAAARPRAAKSRTAKPGSAKAGSAKAGTAKPGSGRGGRRRAGAATRRRLVIDGTNVMCGDAGHTRLELTLSMVVAAAGRGRDVLCIFDASTPHRLRDAAERDLYEWLLQEKSHYFVQCPGRSEADALILAEADRMQCPVVSNDFFRDREDRFPWVRDPDRVLRHQPIRDVVYLDETALPIEPDLRRLQAKLDELLQSAA